MQYTNELHQEVVEFQDRNRLAREIVEFPHMILANVAESISRLADFRPNRSEEDLREHARRVGEVLYHLVRYANSHGIKLDYALSMFMVDCAKKLREAGNGLEALSVA